MADSRAEGEPGLYELLADRQVSDQALELLYAALVGYARPVLLSWIGSGRIYRECARHRRPLSPSDDEREHLGRHPEDAEELVGDALAMGLRLLQSSAVSGTRAWDPDGPASLTTFYVTACVLSFPTPYRRWSREFRRRPVPTPPDDGAFARLTAPDPAGLVETGMTTTERLDAMPQLVRDIARLKVDGLTHDEIAAQLGLSSGRAVEGVLRRFRGPRKPDGGWS